MKQLRKQKKLSRKNNSQKRKIKRKKDDTHLIVFQDHYLSTIINIRIC